MAASEVKLRTQYDTINLLPEKILKITDALILFISSEPWSAMDASSSNSMIVVVVMYV